MMQVIPGKVGVKGSIKVPSSKSMLQRYMIGALLAEGKTVLHHVSHCSDTISCMAAIEALGAEVLKLSGDGLQITGRRANLEPLSQVINCGESGFALRALTAVASMHSSKIMMTGSGTLLDRPVDFMAAKLEELGVKFSSSNGRMPFTVYGPIQFKDLVLDGSLTSQFLSGLLMIFPFAEQDHLIEVLSLKSRQYIDLTIQVMNDFGIKVDHDGYQKFRIPGMQRYKGCTAVVEGDWSAASCMLVAGATAGEVRVGNLLMKSNQPDKMILEVLINAGAEISIHENEIISKKSAGQLKPFSVDARGCPDLFPALTALAIQCDGVSEIIGVDRLIHKESNRALALQQEFSKMNDALISIEGNTMKVNGGKLQGAEVHSHHDHRIAMALAVAGLHASGRVVIAGSEAVEKSYPDFFNDLSRLIES